jgi:hypothetical protein
MLRHKGPFFSADINHVMPYLAAFTVDFFATLPSRLEAHQSYVLPLLRFDLSTLARFCRGLALADPIHCADANAFARVWVHELMREVMDRLPPSVTRTSEAVWRHMAMSLTAKVPLEDDSIVTLQRCITRCMDVPMLFTDSSWLRGLRVRIRGASLPADPQAETASALERRHSGGRGTDEETFSYIEMSSAAQDSQALILDASGPATNKRRLSVFRRQSGERLSAAKESAYGLPCKDNQNLQHSLCMLTRLTRAL